MPLFELATLMIVVTAGFTYLNDRFVKLPNTIGVMLLALVSSLVLVFAGHYTVGVRNHAQSVLHQIDFSALLLHGMLAFLLFAGAIHANVSEMRRQWGTITLLALVGTLLSTAAIGFGLYGGMSYLGWNLPLMICLIFGAIISPTDPVAVVGIMKSTRAPAELEAQLAGESLFNDGIAIVLFDVLLETYLPGPSPSVVQIIKLFLAEAGGGILIGLAAGGLVYQMLKRVDHDQVELLLTIALAMGVYAGASALHVSPAIAVVVAGLIIGEKGRAFAMTHESRESIDTFWEMIDGLLNSLLFLLIGVGVLVLPFNRQSLIAGVLAIVVSLAARWLSVAGVIKLIGLRKQFIRGTIAVLTWGGLRGGIAVAMALSLPHDSYRDLLLVATYCVVVVSVLAQGLSIGRVIQQTCRRSLPNPYA